MTSMAKLGKVLVLDLLNADNGKNFTFDDIVFHDPEPSVVPEGIRNTRLKVTPAPGSRLRNEQTVSYWRIDLERVVPEAERTVPAVGVTNTSQLVALLNQKYGLAMDHTDVLYETIDTSVLPRTYKLIANKFSYAFIGELTLTLDNGLTSLLSVLTKSTITDLLSRGNAYIGSGSSFATDSILNISGFPVDVTHMQRQQNSEAEVGTGVVVGINNALGTTIEAGTNSLVEVQLTANQNWYLVAAFGLLDSSLRNKGSLVTDYYDVVFTVQWGTLETAKLKLVNDDAGLQWVPYSYLGGLQPTLTQIPNVVGRTMAINMKELTAMAFGGLVDSTTYAALGAYEVTLTLTPKQAKQIAAISRRFVVIATRA